MSARHSVRVGNPVTGQPFAKILRLANVEDRVIRIPHEINAGLFRQLAEEIAAQPLDQWLRVREQKLLGRGHRTIKHDRPEE
jgi:hypothetical protein